jgi:hypothetical protein
MARGSDQAKTAATTGQNLANTYSGNAGQLFNTLAPVLQSEVAHPPGFTPPDLAAMDTAAQESAGGSMAGAVGQGGLLAARTRNAGAGAAAIGQSARTAQENLGSAAVKTRLANAAEREKQRQSGISGLGALYGENVSGGNQALGIVPQAVNADTNAANQSWDWAKYLLDPAMAASGQAATGALHF